MVEKIKNLSLTTTKEQLNTQWSQVLSKKNKMLQASDWTQLDDVAISEQSRNEWRIWRQKIRRIKRLNFRNPDDALIALDALENIRPIETGIHEELFNDKNKELLQLESKTIEKVFVEKQPIVLHQKLSLDDFKSLFYQAFQDNPYDLQNYLRAILNVEPGVVFFDFDDLTVAKNKTIIFIKKLSKTLLDAKLDNIGSRETINAKLDEALDFLTTDKIDIEDYPLIDLYSQILKKPNKQIALQFLDEKKAYNKIIFESEKFLMYNILRVQNCDSISHLRELIEEIKNGY